MWSELSLRCAKRKSGLDSSTSAFLLQSVCITDHISNTLCLHIDSVAGLQMTLCVVSLSLSEN